MRGVLRYGSAGRNRVALRVLLVDDEGVVLRAIERLLATAFEVTTASDHAEAIAAFFSSPPDVLVTDLALGPEHGEALLVVVRQQFPSVGCVVLSGSTTRFERLVGQGLADVALHKGDATPTAILDAVRWRTSDESPICNVMLTHARGRSQVGEKFVRRIL